MINFKVGALEINVKELGDKMEMDWQGKSDSKEAYGVLTDYFGKVIENIHGLKAMNIKFNKLAYMNSSTVTPIVEFLRQLNDKAVQTTVFYDRNSEWQAMSFKALECIAITMANLEVVPE